MIKASSHLFLVAVVAAISAWTAPCARADAVPYSVSTDPFDSTQGTVILTNDVILDPINSFRTNGGFEDGHTLMRNGGLGSVSFIEFQTGGRVSIEGVRLFAGNDGAGASFRRSLSRFQLWADVDDNGSFETLAVDSGAINQDYGTQPGNASADPQILDLTLTNIGGLVVSAQHWRMETTQGSDMQPFEGARVIEVDALEAPPLVVTNADNSGPGSLREAILNANANPGVDTIQFNIPGPGPYVIQPSTDLPVLSDPVRIDATTQPGYASQPLIELDGRYLEEGVGLNIQTSDSVVSGLALTHLNFALVLSGSQSSRNWIHGNYFGLDTTGTNTAGNADSITIHNDAHHNIIGTDGDGVNDAAERNVISGNQYGFVMYNAFTNRIAGNYIGTDYTGTNARGNQDAFYIDSSSMGNIFGTDSSDDTFNANERNVISGNLDRGFILSGPNRVSGNYIGTDPTGSFAVPNQFGLQVTEIGSLVGSDGDGMHDEEERNVISGNSNTGIIVGGPETRDVVVRGNYIGTDASGTLAVPNSDAGISLHNQPNHILITENVISGNTYFGIISANGSYSNIITGNLIGVDASGTNPLGNGDHGVYLVEAPANTIGGTLPGDANVIAYNGGNGVVVQGEGTTAIRNSILGNAIFANGSLGIDLGPDGVTPNDSNSDSDTGPNNLQNFPIISSALIYGSTLVIEGTLGSLIGTNRHRLELFSSPGVDVPPYANGKHFLGGQMVTSGLGGVASFRAVLTAPDDPEHWITATATDQFGNTSEFSAMAFAQSANPPQITAHPTNVVSAPGNNVTLCVTASGSSPIYYQWRKNGVNLLGATNSCLTLLAVGARDGGSYDVVVYNSFEAILSNPASVVVTVTSLPPGNNFAARVALPENTGTVRGSNVNATFEVGEPNHVGKPGGRSVWYSFTSASVGVMTIDTAGSSFDTLLAVYTGSSLATLVNVASDEESGGALTSEVRFNVQAGVEYKIAVDGYAGATGTIILNWTFELTASRFPVIVTHPASATVAPGSNYTFSVTVTGDALTYQWYLNGNPISGATSVSLTVTNVDENDLGTYVLRITQGARSINTHPATLQINQTGGAVQTARGADKLPDARREAPPIMLGDEGGGGGAGVAASVVRGYTGTQVLNTHGAAGSGELPICGVLGGASVWVAILAAQDGVLHLNTDGSSYNTVLAVYDQTPGVNTLRYLGCNNNGGADHIDSAVAVGVLGGRTNFVQIDGVNGATGLLKLNYSLVIPSALTPLGKNLAGQYQFMVAGRPDMAFTIQHTTDLINWITLFSGTDADGSYLFTDTTAPPPASRIYRLLMGP